MLEGKEFNLKSDLKSCVLTGTGGTVASTLNVDFNTKKYSHACSKKGVQGKIANIGMRLKQASFLI